MLCIFVFTNNILKFNENNIFIVFDKSGNIWFGMKDLFRALGYKGLLKLFRFNISQEFIKKYKDIKVSPSMSIPYNLQLNTKMVNEAGLNYILINSKKTIAKQFTMFYLKEVMQEIRKTGQYIVNKKDKIKLDKINDKLNNYKEENKFLSNDNKYVPSKTGYLYIKKMTSYVDGKKVITYKFGRTKNIKKRLGTHRTSDSKSKIIFYIITELDKVQLEGCIKNVNKFVSIKKNYEIVYKSLKNLKDDIINCSSLIAESICKCVKCKKKFKVGKLNKHKCIKYFQTRFIKAE